MSTCRTEYPRDELAGGRNGTPSGLLPCFWAKPQPLTITSPLEGVPRRQQLRGRQLRQSRRATSHTPDVVPPLALTSCRSGQDGRSSGSRRPVAGRYVVVW